MVALALIELGLPYEDAVDMIRKYVHPVHMSVQDTGCQLIPDTRCQLIQRYRLSVNTRYTALVNTRYTVSVNTRYRVSVNTRYTVHTDRGKPWNSKFKFSKPGNSWN